MITPENLNLDTLTDEEAREILSGMQKSVEFLFHALDTDGDGQLSPAEIDAAPDVLRSLDKDGDGELNETELEGYGFHFMPGRVRFNSIVRMLDLDGDLRVTAEDIADAPNRIRRLDKDRDGIVRFEDAIAKRNVTVARRVGGPVDLIKMMINLAYYTDEITGNVLPGSDSRGMSDGYTLHYEANNNNDIQIAKDAFLLGADGKPVHTWHNEYDVPEATSADLLPNGLLLRTVTTEDITKVHDWFPVAAHGTVQLVDWEGNVVWQYTRCARGKYCLHHDSRAMPNGNILVLSWEALTKNEAIALGWEPQEFLNARGDGYVWSERVLELEPNLEDGSTKVVWEWAVIDHIVQAYDSSKPNYGQVSENRHKLNFNYAKYENYLFTFGQLYHLNSVAYNEELDQIILSSANFSELWIIDHSHSTEETRGPKGDLLFRWGNPETYSDDPNPTFNHKDKKSFWQHDVQWLNDESKPHTGDILFINNGAMRGVDGLPNPNEKRMGFGTAYTEVMELSLPSNGDGTYDWDGEVVTTWSYKGDPPQDMFAPFMSGVDRTPSGNTVFAFGHNKRIMEVTPEGEVVADFRVPGPGNLFRVRRYGFDYPGLDKLK